MTASLRRVLGALAVLLGATVLLAPATPAAPTSRVSGTVSIVGDGTTPVDGWVYFYRLATGDPDETCPGSADGVLLTDGGFSTTALPDGRYKVRVKLTTMDDYSRWWDGSDGGSAGCPAGVVTLSGGDPVTLDLAVEPIAHVSGRVTNGDGDAMAGLTVERTRLGVVSSTMTGADGRYDFGYVRSGTSVVAADGTGGWGGAQQSVSVPVSGELTVDLVLPQAARVVGTVTDSAGGTPEFVTATVYRISDAALIGSDRTDAQGRFQVGGLGAGDFAVEFSDGLGGYPTTWNGGAFSLNGATPLPTVPGEAVRADETLTQLPGPCAGPGSLCRLSGVVTSAAPAEDPLAGIQVTAYAADGTAVATDATDRSGRWGLTGLGQGSYRLGVAQGSVLSSYTPGLVPWYPEFYPDAWGYADADPVTLGAGPVTGLALALERAGQLTLSVKGPRASTLVDAGYRVVDPSGDTMLAHPPTTGDGSQLTVLVRPGTWKLLVQGHVGPSRTGSSLVPQWFGGGTSAALAPAYSFDPGQTRNGGTVRLPGALVATTPPQVTGLPRVGRTLRVSHGQWNQMTDTTFSYAWKRGRAVVQRGPRYVVRAADAGATLTVRVNARNGTLSTLTTLSVRIRR